MSKKETADVIHINVNGQYFMELKKDYLFLHEVI